MEGRGTLLGKARPAFKEFKDINCIKVVKDNNIAWACFRLAINKSSPLHLVMQKTVLYLNQNSFYRLIAAKRPAFPSLYRPYYTHFGGVVFIGHNNFVFHGN